MNKPQNIPSRTLEKIFDPPFRSGHVRGHRARRLIDGQDSASADPFLLMAEDWMPRDAFGQHPHRGIETVTIVLEGALEHFDSAGHRGVIESGDAQWMTAGRGVIHEENATPGRLAHTLQLWVNLPASAKMTEPRYQDLRGPALPVRSEPGVEVRVLSGQSGNILSPTLNHVPTSAIDARLQPGSSFTQGLEADVNAFVMALEGQLSIGLDGRLIAAGQFAWLTRSNDPNGSTVRFEAGDTPSRILLFAGRPLREPVVFGGPFVMNTRAEIEQAFSDYREGLF